MAPQGTDFHHQFIAFLKQPYLALCGERQQETYLVCAIPFSKHIGFLGLRYRGWILALSIQHFCDVLQPHLAENLMGKKRHPSDWYGRKVFFHLAQYMVLRTMPLAEPGVPDLRGKHAVDDHGVHRQSM